MDLLSPSTTQCRHIGDRLQVRGHERECSKNLDMGILQKVK